MLGSWLARGSLRPIKEINLTARRITGTHLEETIPTTGNRDELDDLAHTLNEMIASIRASVVRMQRFSANAAHELRTPLNAMRSRIDVTLEKQREPEEYRRILGEMAEEVESLSSSVHAMMRLAQSEAGLQPEQRVPVEISSLLGEVVEFFRPLASRRRGAALFPARRSRHRTGRSQLASPALCQPAPQRRQVHAGRRAHRGGDRAGRRPRWR